MSTGKHSVHKKASFKEGSLSSSSTSYLESRYNMTVYPQFTPQKKGEMNRGNLLLLIIGSLLFVIIGIAMIMTGKKGDILNGWGIALFFGFCLSVSLIPLIWGPLLIFDEQEIYIRSNPLFKGIKLQWSEIAKITPSNRNGKSCLCFIVEHHCLEDILQRQSPLSRKMLKRRLRHSNLIISIPQWLLLYSSKALLTVIQKRYYEQIQQYHIDIPIDR